MKTDCPRIVIAGTNSGVGKTSVSLALTAALRQRGYKVQTFKVGPDFLDPSYLALASGRPCYNLDGWMTDEGYVRSLFFRASQNADISIIEGVMGLFDGASPSALEGSTAEVAAWLEAPVLLVANVHGMARSIAALVKGYTVFDPTVQVAGVVANQCGSSSHVASLSESLKVSSLPPLLGAIPRKSLPELKSRHLGLVTARKGDLGTRLLNDFAGTFEVHCAVDDIVAIARKAPLAEGEPFTPSSDGKGIRVGIAFDNAFHFYYQDLFDEMERQGCEVIRFSPMEDKALPGNIDALYLGGGYPEEHATILAGNRQMKEEVRRFGVSGRPVYAECGGLIYLSRTLETLDGRRYPMAGLLPVDTRMLESRKALGYVEATIAKPSLWGSRGTTFRGHEFHYSELVEAAQGDSGWKGAYRMKQRRTGTVTEEGFQRENILASYAHLHFASRPEAVSHFIARCRGGI